MASTVLPFNYHLPRSLWRLPNRIWSNEDGSATVYALFIFVICMMLGGLAVETTNIWRTRTELSVIADIGAHAGVVELTRAHSTHAAQTLAEQAVADNIPSKHADPARTRSVIAPTKRVLALHYDPVQNLILPNLPEDPAINAIAVQVRYDAAEGTSLPSIFPQIMGHQGWNVEGHSIAALVPSERCVDGNGLFSRGKILLYGYMELGEDVCFHAQRQMAFWMPPKLARGAHVSLPNLKGCKEGCEALLASASAEINLLQPDFAAHMNMLGQSFIARTSPPKSAFFASRPMARDLSALAELGVDVSELKHGAVVDLQPIQMLRARHLPRGLVYRVSCVGTPEDTFLILGAPGPTLHGSALVTNCPVVVSQARGLSRALVISSWDGITGATLPGIEIMARGSGGFCRKDRSVLMARQPILLLPGASASGLGIVSATEVTLQEPPTEQPETVHRGLSVHAGQIINVEGQHKFEACPSVQDNGLLPPRRIIRHVEPGNLHNLFPAMTKPKTVKVGRVSPTERLHSETQDEAHEALP